MKLGHTLRNVDTGESFVVVNIDLHSDGIKLARIPRGMNADDLGRRFIHQSTNDDACASVELEDTE